MPSGSGLDTQVMTGVESTYGTAVTPNRAHEVVSESLERNQTTLVSNALRSTGRNPRKRGIVSARMGAGDVTMEIAASGFGRWFEHLLGGTPTIAQQDATDAFLHTYEMGDLVGKSLTVQKGIAQTDGTVQPFTFKGCKVTSGEFSISVDQIAQLRLTLDARDVDDEIELEEPTYPDANLFHFMQGSLKVGVANIAAVTSANISINNNLKTDRFYLGSAGLKAEPIDNDWPAISGTLDAEFVDKTFFDHFADDNAVSLELKFEGAIIDYIYKETLTVTVPEVRFSGDTPKASGPEVIVQNVPFDGHYDGTNAGIKVEYLTSDVAA